MFLVWFDCYFIALVVCWWNVFDILFFVGFWIFFFRIICVLQTHKEWEVIRSVVTVQSIHKTSMTQMQMCIWTFILQYFGCFQWLNDLCFFFVCSLLPNIPYNYKCNILNIYPCFVLFCFVSFRFFLIWKFVFVFMFYNFKSIWAF